MTSSLVPRVRFAPSPTGYFHVGGARTALYNWIVARQGGGTFVLRIEDTDRERSDPEWTEGILASLRWLGIEWDEGPFFQSERGALHRAAAERLFAAGNAYACDCTRGAVEERTKDNPVPGYDGYCRDRGLPFTRGNALRFRVPDEGTTVVHDLVRGDVEFQNATIDDFVIVKSNGDPLFVLAVVVDDLDMGITAILRAEEHLPTTPKAVLLWEVLGDGRPLPAFAHLPVLVNERRQKLSKRRDRVAVEDYRALGYLPEALVNYLALLGWAPSDGREVLTREELVAEFRLEDVNHSPAFFDEQRLAHFNGLYIRALPTEEFVARCRPFLLAEHGLFAPDHLDEAAFARLAPLVQERVTTLAEVPALVAFLFASPFVPDEAAVEKAIVRDGAAADILERAITAFGAGAFDKDTLRESLAEIAEAVERKLGKAQAPVRVATLGASAGLPLFESLEELGRERVLERLRNALERATSAA
jgi:glutamyl-tRNA synthetase